MVIALIVIAILISVFLVLVVLAQNPKGGGLSSTFGGGASQIMGVQKTGDILEKITWGLAIALVVVALSSNLWIKSGDGGGQQLSPNLERAQEEADAPLFNTPPASTNQLDSSLQILNPDDSAQ